MDNGPRIDLLLAGLEYLRSELKAVTEAKRLSEESLRQQVEDLTAKVNQYRIRAMNGERRIDTIIFHAMYKNVDEAISLLLAGDQKRGIVKLRYMLPESYKNTFIKKKAAA